ncbi:hypothetical protein ACFLU5_02180 [Bacteroidota bacterium]
MRRHIYFLLFIALLGISISCREKPKDEFTHRGYLGWFMDLSRTARIGYHWPSIEIDSALMADYEETLAFFERSRMTEITIWGLFTNSAWEPVIKNTIDMEREEIVREVIDMAHEKGIKVICGLGIYSWGFDKIMDAYPDLRCPCNERTMDLANPEAMEWQKKVIDYIMDGYDFDGFSTQSADQGRCTCGAFGELSTMEYHAILNQQVINHIRSKDKDYIIGISGWGMNFGDPGDLESIVKMTRNLDYLNDVGETVLKRGRDYRKKFIQAIFPCKFGNIGTPNVEPIHAMRRDHYFVPTAKRACRNLQELYQDGGRACEVYYRSRSNPGDEITVEVIANLLSNPAMPYENVLKSTLSFLYQPADDAAMQEFVEILSEAEDAFFNNTREDRQIILLLSRGALEPSSEYLEKMPTESLMAYKSVMSDLYDRANSLSNKVNNQEKFRKVLVCFENVIEEIRLIENKGDASHIDN